MSEIIGLFAGVFLFFSLGIAIGRYNPTFACKARVHGTDMKVGTCYCGKENDIVSCKVIVEQDR